jgi:singapore isolate B (sub-type 7) whole genome shotgun sequence assembly, scaffold_1
MEGRPVYEFTMKNLIDLQNTDTITVSYELNPLVLWREPLMCISAFFILFLVKAIVKKVMYVNKEKTD